MTAKELAQLLDGRECGEMTLTTAEEQEMAQKSGLVIVYGELDDLLEFEGAFYDEIGAYEGCEICIENGCLVHVDENCEDCPYFQESTQNNQKIIAVWHDEGNPYWTIETEIPHEKFNIYEYGKLFCVGIVFDIADTMRKPAVLDRSRWEGCGYCNDTTDAEAYEFCYCPYCGKPLTEEAWKQLERRI